MSLNVRDRIHTLEMIGICVSMVALYRVVILSILLWTVAFKATTIAPHTDKQNCKHLSQHLLSIRSAL